VQITLDVEDYRGIAEQVATLLKPLIINVKESDTVFDKEGLAKYLCVEVSWINKQITLRAIPYFKMGKYTRFKKSHIDQWMETLKVKPSPYLKLLKRA
jgi:excisionase family DNA binding protein